MSGVKSPSEFLELSTELAQLQLINANRAGEATHGARPTGDARDCRAAEDTAGAVVDLRFISGTKWIASCR